MVTQETRVLRIAAVKAKTGLGTSAIYKKIQDGEFPRPIPLGVRTRGWLEHEVASWIAERRAERDAGDTWQRLGDVAARGVGKLAESK